MLFFISRVSAADMVSEPVRVVITNASYGRALEQLAAMGRVRLTRAGSGETAWSLLKEDKADVVAMEVLTALERISGDGTLALFASLGRPAELAGQSDVNRVSPHRVVLVARRERLLRERIFFNKFVEELIRNHCHVDRKPEERPGQEEIMADFASDPDPGYDELARLWKSRGLGRPGQPRDYLSSHVIEEYYCDALYYLADRSPEDEKLRELLARAVCVPNCCTVYPAMRSTAAK